MIFHLHIPKTGGSSFVDLLLRQYGERYYRTPNRLILDQRLLRKMAEDVRRYSCISGHYAYGLHERWPVDEFIYLTFVRDPVDRLLSLYHYLKERPAGHKYRDEVAALSFGEFAVSTRPDWTFLDNDMVRRISGLGAARRAVEWADLEQAIANLDTFAAVGLTDRFDETIARWAQRFGWTNVTYCHRLAQPERLKQEELPAELVEEVRQRQQFDCALYAHVLKRDWADV